MKQLTHIDESGAAVMVDVSAKAETARSATARGAVFMKPETLDLICQGGLKKGDVLSVARLAGIMAAKRTADLIPMCHPLVLDSIDVSAELVEDGVRFVVSVACEGKTGVEMEAMTGAAVHLSCKAPAICPASDASACVSVKFTPREFTRWSLNNSGGMRISGWGA